MKQITREQILELVDYCSETGIFTNKVARGGLKVGARAGNFDMKGYRVITVAGHKLLEHRAAWFLTYNTWPIQVDHRDHDKGNNKILNLRSCTNTQNQVNTPTYGTKLPRGVSKVTLKPGWFMAQIVLHYKKLYLGSFPTKEEAHEAYKKKHLEVHKEFSIYHQKEIA